MKLLPDLKGDLKYCSAQLDKHFDFSALTTHIAYKVNLKEQRLENLYVNIDHQDQVVLWSLSEAMHEAVKKIFEERINNFIQTERISKHQDIHKIRPYIQDLLNSPSFEPLRELETFYDQILEDRMRDAAIQFVNEHITYNMPQIISPNDHDRTIDDHHYLFDEPIYYHLPTRSLTFLQPDDRCIPIGKVKLIFEADDPVCAHRRCYTCHPEWEDFAG